jgi:membrane glycosyltransferase
MRFLTLSADPEDLSAATSSSMPQYLFLFTMVLLFLPRVLGILTMLPQARQYGGVIRLVFCALLENILSALLAPVLMMFHTFFVLMTVFGWQIKWTTQNRADTGLTFGHCLKLYGWLTCLGVAVYPIASIYLGRQALWLTPILAGWILAPVLAWFTSGLRTGKFFRSCGLFVTPEEFQPPTELQNLEEEEEEEDSNSPLWVQALLSPYVQAVHLSLVRQGSSSNSDGPVQSSLATLGERLIREGPGALNAKEKLRLLWDGETVFWLHQELWARPESKMHSSWTKLQTECSSSRLLSSYLMTS